MEQVTNEVGALSEKDRLAKTNALIAYGLMVIGFFFLIPGIIGGIWAMVKKEDALGSIFEDHYSNMIRVFWWSIFYAVIGLILAFVYVGYLILIVAGIWAIYRIVKGLARLTSNKAYKA
ncbi:hypothetical protein SG35_017940 [Thalassomonas actiniarum]|uniref:DUF4870 domain-containing protein n=1 Tax=Thalassomonas actiniarum TaxID=485447 RepID=A0AAE9YYL9_9GAMM|nr:hypothetical protein SG35_017940 [Thalassomonas actiniarum]